MRYFALAAAAAAFISGSAHAQSLDMSTIACKDLVGMPIERIAAIGFWMSGYYASKANSTVIDFARMADNAKAMSGVCLQNPNLSVMQAIEQVSK